MAMNLEEANRTLSANQNIEKGSFLHELHENLRFNKDLFWTLYNACAIVGTSEWVERDEIRQKFFWVYRSFLNSVIFHLDPHDRSEIKDFPATKIALFIEALEWVCHSPILGHQLKDWHPPSSELANSKMEELSRYFQSN